MFVADCLLELECVRLYNNCVFVWDVIVLLMCGSGGSAGGEAISSTYSLREAGVPSHEASA